MSLNNNLKKRKREINNVVLPIRKLLSEWKNDFNGEFTENCQEDSITKPLLSLVSLLIDGNDIKRRRYSREALTCSQLIMFNV